MAAWLNSIVTHLKCSCRKDPGKAAVLVLLLVVMALLWVRVLDGGGAGPGSAEASGVTSSSPRGEDDGASKPGGVESGALIQAWLEAPIGPMERNLFSVRLDYFPRDGGRDARRGTDSMEGFWEQLEKSAAAEADQRRERQILVENLRRQASQLRLQTIVMGDLPKAMINGKPVGEGDVVETFRVIRIDARRVVIEREGIRFELHMK